MSYIVKIVPYFLDRRTICLFILFIAIWDRKRAVLSRWKHELSHYCICVECVTHFCNNEIGWTRRRCRHFQFRESDFPLKRVKTQRKNDVVCMVHTIGNVFCLIISQDWDETGNIQICIKRICIPTASLSQTTFFEHSQVWCDLIWCTLWDKFNFSHWLRKWDENFISTNPNEYKQKTKQNEHIVQATKWAYHTQSQDGNGVINT